MAYSALYIFPAANGLKKSYQLLISLNEIHTTMNQVRFETQGSYENRDLSKILNNENTRARHI